MVSHDTISKTRNILTIAQIIVAIIPIGARIDFTMNTVDILLGWTNANGNCMSQIIRNEVSLPEVIPADSGRSEEIVSSVTNDKMDKRTIGKFSPVMTENTTKHHVHKITGV